MSDEPINKSMDRGDLLTPSGQEFVAGLSALSDDLERRNLPLTSWYGGLLRARFEFSPSGVRSLVRRALGRGRGVGSVAEINRGGEQYEPIPGIRSDVHHPWFLYWEAYWVSSRGPELTPSTRVLDAGGTASLFSCHLASRGAETHSVDLNPRLVAAGEQVARAMGWNLHSYSMDMTALEFEDGSFDHAYSICVFEHLTADLRQRALTEIARVLRPGGILSLTFDYGAPGVTLMGTGPSTEAAHRLQTPADVHRHFGSHESFEIVGNQDFFDNGRTYLAWPEDPSRRYSFGAIFLRRR